MNAPLNPVGLGTTPLPWPEKIAEPAPRRAKLWELEERLHCPVVGTCLAIERLRHLAARFNFDGDPHDDYRLHVEAVQLSLARNPFSQALHKQFERDYAAAVRQFNALKTEAEVERAWRQSLQSGEVAGALWAALTHKACSPRLRGRIEHDMHMLSHQVGAGLARDARRLAQLERQLAEQQQVHATQQREAKQREAALRRELASREAEQQQLQQQAASAQTLKAQLAALQQREAEQQSQRELALLRSENAALKARLKTLTERSGQLHATQAALDAAEEQLAAATLERDTLRRLLEGAAEAQAECHACPQQAALAPRCVLCVGGRTALVAQYRELAERLGMRLTHHDGGREEALSRLPELIAGADAVICPTDCVSHSAYYQLKRHCRRTATPCLFYQGAGVGSFSQALARLHAGEASLTPAH